MSALAVILIVVGVLLLLLFVGGYIANSRRRGAERAALVARAREADRHLASAHASDKGWERTVLEEAAREAYTARHGAAPQRLTLVQVVDRPGVEEDEAVFDADGDTLVMGRRGGEWGAVDR
jgi:Tfp pilus assembly protein PilE